MEDVKQKTAPTVIHSPPGGAPLPCISMPAKVPTPTTSSPKIAGKENKAPMNSTTSTLAAVAEVNFRSMAPSTGPRLGPRTILRAKRHNNSGGGHTGSTDFFAPRHLPKPSAIVTMNDDPPNNPPSPVRN